MEVNIGVEVENIGRGLFLLQVYGSTLELSYANDRELMSRSFRMEAMNKILAISSPNRRLMTTGETSGRKLLIQQERKEISR